MRNYKTIGLIFQISLISSDIDRRLNPLLRNDYRVLANRLRVVQAIDSRELTFPQTCWLKLNSTRNPTTEFSESFNGVSHND